MTGIPNALDGSSVQAVAEFGRDIDHVRQFLYNAPWSDTRSIGADLAPGAVDHGSQEAGAAAILAALLYEGAVIRRTVRVMGVRTEFWALAPDSATSAISAP